MTIVKWEPFRDLMVMQDRMTRLFDETFPGLERGCSPGSLVPPVDILERGNEIVLKFDLPEVSQSEIEIKVEENTLIVQGERKFRKETSEENYLQIERPYGTFRRNFIIPRTIDPKEIRASCKDGVLRVILLEKARFIPGGF